VFVPQKEIVTEALQRIDGLRVVDVGSLGMNGILEGLAPVVIGVKHPTRQFR